MEAYTIFKKKSRMIISTSIGENIIYFQKGFKDIEEAKRILGRELIKEEVKRLPSEDWGLAAAQVDTSFSDIIWGTLY